MKNTTILVIIGIVIVAVGAFIFMNSDNSSGNVNGSVTAENKDPAVIQGETQKVMIGIKNYNYYPNTIEVEAGKPVEITLDKSVTGCYRSFNIKSLGISKNAKTPEDKIIFTPTKPGTYTFACAMGMGYGKLIVK